MMEQRKNITMKLNTATTTTNNSKNNNNNNKGENSTNNTKDITDAIMRQWTTHQSMEKQ